MIKEIIEIKLKDEFKDKALNLIDETIDKVAKAYGSSLSDKDKRKIKNLALDQVNVNVSHRANSKTLWVFNVENNLPILVEKDKGLPKMGPLIQENNNATYQMKPNLTWTLSKDNDGFSQDEFEEKVLEMLLEDIETAAFYGVLSYVGDSNEY